MTDSIRIQKVPFDPDGRPYMMVPLTQGQSCAVDPEDYAWAMQWKWQAHWSPLNQSFYAKRTKRNIQMSRELTKAPKGLLVDHRNGCTIDNRKVNLRIATSGQNQFNQGKPCTNKSGFKGVSWYKRRATWIATISLNDKTTHLGYFATPEAAHEAYKKAAIAMHGEFARFE